MDNLYSLGGLEQSGFGRLQGTLAFDNNQPVDGSIGNVEPDGRGKALSWEIGSRRHGAV